MIDFGDPRADLGAFGLIGFQNAWLRRQNISPKRSVLRKILEECRTNSIHLAAINTEDDKINFDSENPYPEDRFGFLKGEDQIEYAEDDELGMTYSISLFGNSFLRADFSPGYYEDVGKTTIFLANSQRVHVRDGGRDLKHLVIGANDIEQGRSLRETVDECNSRGLPHFIMYGDNGLEKNEREILFDSVVKDSTGVVGHNASSCLPFSGIFSKVPGLAKHCRKTNYEAQEFANFGNAPFISISGAHRIEDIGLNASIPIYDLARCRTEEDFFKSIKESIGEKEYLESRRKMEYHNPIVEANLHFKLQKYGGKPDRFAGERSSWNE